MRRGLVVMACGLLMAACQADPDARVSEASPQERVDVGTEVVVLGDSTGNGLNEWVALWGQTHTGSRSVVIRQWDFNLETFAPDWTRLGGDGPPLRIWNLSHPGAVATYPLGRLDDITATPDTVVVSFGYNSHPDDVVPELARLADRVEQQWPGAEVVVTLQGAATAAADPHQQWQREKVPAIREWAEGRGYPTIDVWSAFEDAPGPVSRLVMEDGLHPDEDGNAVWVEAVSEALTVR